jgi:hypothetical protein
MFLHKPMLALLAPGTTVVPQYSPGVPLDIYGGADVTGDNQAADVVPGAVTNRQVSQTSGAITLTESTWVTVASFSFTSVGIGVELQAFANINVFQQAGLPTVVWRLVRNAGSDTAIKTGVIEYGRSSSGGGGFTEYYRAAAMAHNDLPSSGTYTYKFQIKIEGNGETYFATQTATERTLMAVEYKR